jgi:Raf kinase inhibitor-like YbhB/YbcL family protein
MSYAVALVDKTNTFVHWTLWDVPATTTSLPAMLPTTQVLTAPIMGKQVNRFTGDGYYGPCPGATMHTYAFEVYALDVATLPGLSATSTTDDVRAQMMAHSLATGTLTGMAKTQ